GRSVFDSEAEEARPDPWLEGLPSLVYTFLGLPPGRRRRPGHEGQVRQDARRRDLDRREEILRVVRFVSVDDAPDRLMEIVDFAEVLGQQQEGAHCLTEEEDNVQA